jgi:hypothetical protein
MFGAPQPSFELVGQDGSIEVSRTSMFTRQRNTMRLPITREQFGRWQAGAMIQDAFPHLTPDQREFIQSGATTEEWAAIFPPEEEDE